MFLTIEQVTALARGMVLTLGLMVAALGVSGSLCSTLCAAHYLCRRRGIICAIAVFQRIMRGTPLLTQMFFIYYGSAAIPGLRQSFLWTAFQHPFFCATLALGLNSAAYLSVAFQSAVAHHHRHHYLPAKALGLTDFQIWRYILYPMSCQQLLPYCANEVVMVFKATALASTVSLLDFMGVTQRLIASTYQPMVWLPLAGGVYCLFNMLWLGLFHCVERLQHQRMSPYA